MANFLFFINPISSSIEAKQYHQSIKVIIPLDSISH